MAIRQLDEVCEFIVDCPHMTAPAAQGLPFGYAVGTKALVGGRIALENARPVDEVTYQRWIARATPQAGDLILAREAPVGPVAVVPAEPLICLGQRTVLVRPDREQLDTHFLHALLGSSLVQRRMHERAEGSTIAHLNVAEVRRLELEIPPIGDQRAIASVLLALNDKIASDGRVVALLDDAAATIFDRPTVPHRTVRMDDLVEVRTGQSPPGATYGAEGCGPLLVQGMGGFGERFPRRAVWTSAPSRMAPPGAVLMTVRAPVGAVNITREPTALGRGVAAFISPYRYFTEQLIRSIEGRWSSEQSGTIFPAVNRKQIAGLQVQVPPIDDIQRIDEELKPVVDYLEKLIAEAETLTAIRDALLPKLVSGQIRVPLSDDVEEQIGAATEALATA